MNGLTPDGPAGKICMDPHMRLPLTQPPMSVTSWFLLCCLHSNGTEQRRKPDQSGKHFQTLFTTVTVTKSSLEKKNARFSLSLKKEQIEVTGGSSYNRHFY